jgi:hypothetical protein
MLKQAMVGGPFTHMKRCILTTWFILLACIVPLQNGHTQNATSGGPEGVGAFTYSQPTPTPTPTPTQVGQCPEGEKYDFSESRCEPCIYAIRTLRETLVTDESRRRSYGKPHGIDHMQEATFGPDDVILGEGAPDNSVAFRDIQTFLDNRINFCLTPQDWQDPNSPSPWDTGWNLNFSQCVVYGAYEEYHLKNLLPNGDWDPLQDPSYSFQFQIEGSNRWHLSDIHSIWEKDRHGNLVRRDLPGGAFFESSGSGVFISYHDALGNRIDPRTILDPGYINAVPNDLTADPNFLRDRDPKLRDGLNMQVCYSWEVRGVASPISLFMPNCDYRELEPNIVKFKMNPNEPADYTVWRGSQCMPLLVYDPTHSGKITDGSQLIGDWTNGGAPTYDGTKKQWKHGFQVLSTFDKDGDNVVSGKELGALSVWSDNNRNGISEEGEVVSALKFGIKQLRYATPKVMFNGDLYLESGYKLKQANSVINGMLIDWYGHTGRSENELVQHLPHNLISKPDSPINKYRKSCNELSAPTIAGGWRWWMDNDEKKTTRGYLVLGRESETTFKGNSYSLQSAKKKGTPLDLIMGVWPLTATKTGARAATMEIPSQYGSVVSEINVSEDGLTLRGTTLATSGSGASEKYSWTAERAGCTLAK